MAIQTTSTYLLAAAILAGLTLAAPSAIVQWQMEFPLPPYVILAENGLIVTSAETNEAAVYVNTVQAWNRSQEVMWTVSCSGPVSARTTAATFPQLPKLLFLLLSNLQPPNVTAVVPATGEVVWSSSAAFATASSASLHASFDGRTLYLLTEMVPYHKQLTALDAATGKLLFTKEDIMEAANVTRCGPSRSPCVVGSSRTGVTAFWDGRTGALLRNISLPVQSADGSSPSYTPISEELLLLLFNRAGYLLVLNTTNYTLAWRSLPWGSSVGGVSVRAQSYTAAKAKRLAVVAIGISGVLGLDAATGATLWNQTATGICPLASPAPGPASSFTWRGYQVGAFPAEIGAGDMFSFTVNCEYVDNALTVVGAMSATNGVVKWWRYLLSYPIKYPLVPVGPKAFMVCNEREEFYDASLTNFSSFPSNSHTGYSYTVLGVDRSTAIIQWSGYPNRFLVTALSVIWK